MCRWKGKSHKGPAEKDGVSPVPRWQKNALLGFRSRVPGRQRPGCATEIIPYNTSYTRDVLGLGERKAVSEQGHERGTNRQQERVLC